MNGPLSRTLSVERLPLRSFDDWFDRWAEAPGGFCLESSGSGAGSGDWHYLGAHPVGEFIAWGTKWQASLECEGGARTAETVPRGDGDPLAACEDWFSRCGIADDAATLARLSLPAIPFVGGAVGMFGFELGESIDPYPITRPSDHRYAELYGSIPDLHIRVYDELVAIDRQSGAAYAITRGRSGGEERRWWDRGAVPREGHRESPTRELAVSLDDRTYLSHVESIREEIRKGEVYEANLTRTHLVRGGPDPLTLARRLRSLQPVPYAAVLPWEPASLVSASPECFLRRRGSHLESRPIKGTIARGRDVRDDARRGERLLADPKERAELAMIVDLVRNDLGRVAIPGSVRVRAEADLEPYATVIHTVATVEAELAEGRTSFDLLRATFPGGSITGAPKLAALEVIARLEPFPRRFYTGSFGWLAPGGDLDLAIAIRTVTRVGEVSLVSIGGAVTWDSIPTRELAELEAKGAALFAALRGVPGEGAPLRGGDHRTI